MGCSQYILNTPAAFVYRGSANRPTDGSEYVGCLGVDLTNDRLEMYMGSGVWKTVLQPFTGTTLSYTPSLFVNNNATEVTYGTSATRVGRIVYQGTVLRYWGHIVFGSGLSFPTTGPLQLSFPFYETQTKAISLTADMAVGAAQIYDLNTTTGYVAGAYLSSLSDETRISFYASTGAASVNVTTTAPMTWATGDVLSWNVTVPLV